jgi:hypothetical protein
MKCMTLPTDDQDTAPSASPEDGARPLADSRREAFALARAAGLSRIGAYRRAGYAPFRQAASRLARKPEVAARIAWLQAQEAKATGSDTETAIVRLLEMADGADLTTATGIREAREALAEARRVYIELRRLRAAADGSAP